MVHAALTPAALQEVPGSVAREQLDRALHAVIEVPEGVPGADTASRAVPPTPVAADGFVNWVLPVVGVVLAAFLLGGRARRRMERRKLRVVRGGGPKAGGAGGGAGKAVASGGRPELRATPGGAAASRSERSGRRAGGRGSARPGPQRRAIPLPPHVAETLARLAAEEAGGADGPPVRDADAAPGTDTDDDGTEPPGGRRGGVDVWVGE